MSADGDTEGARPPAPVVPLLVVAGCAACIHAIGGEALLSRRAAGVALFASWVPLAVAVAELRALERRDASPPWLVGQAPVLIGVVGGHLALVSGALLLTWLSDGTPLWPLAFMLHVLVALVALPLSWLMLPVGLWWIATAVRLGRAGGTRLKLAAVGLGVCSPLVAWHAPAMLA